MKKTVFIVTLLSIVSTTHQLMCETKQRTQGDQDLANKLLDFKGYLINEKSYPDMWRTLVGKDKRSSLGAQEAIKDFNDAMRAIAPDTYLALQNGSDEFATQQIKLNKAFSKLETIIFQTAQLGNYIKSGKIISDLEGILTKSGIFEKEQIDTLHKMAQADAAKNKK